MNKFYITTPIYYVNDIPHIGSAYTTIAADVLARWHKLNGDRTFFLTGTDEHGAKIETKAREAGKEPQVFVDAIADKFKTTWQNMNISNDRFIRTTETEHIKAVQASLQYMYDKGDIYQGRYEGLYCKGCEQFKSERDLVDGKCTDHGTVPEKMSEDCYMFKLAKYKDELLEKIKNDELKINPPERKNEVASFYEREGLNDIAFSRKNVSWGIPLPWDENQTAYVWADAFLNYLTGLGWQGPDTPRPADARRPSQEGNQFELWPADLHLMSKDILRVHSTIWPAMLLSLDLPLPKEIFVHGFFLVDGKKMSKSLGNVIRPEEMIKRYGVDATRYLLISATPFGHDGDVSWEKFDIKFNSDLANGLGNLVARVSNLLEKNEISINLDFDVLSRASSPDGMKTGKYNDYKTAMAGCRLDTALTAIWQEIKKADEHLTANAPWKMVDKEEIKKVLASTAQDIYEIAWLLEPFMPTAAKTIKEQFSEKNVKKGESLFPRI